MLRIWLFGAVSYRVDEGEEIRLLDLRYPRVLAYLALHPDGPSTKVAIRNAVWGQSGAEDNLRRALRELRADHPQLAAYIRDEGRTVAVDGAAALDVDVLRFKRLVEAERYGEALAEVRGGFMSDHPEQSSEWVDSTRRHWNRQVARVCHIVAAHDWHDQPERAIGLARRAFRLTPSDPAAAIALAGYMAANGESAEAMSELTAFRNEQRRLGQPEARSIDDAIDRLEEGTLGDVPERPLAKSRPSKPRASTRIDTTVAARGPQNGSTVDPGVRRFLRSALASVLVVGLVLGATAVVLGVVHDDRGSSTSLVLQPDTPGVAPRDRYHRLDARRYHTVLRELAPRLTLSFDGTDHASGLRHSSLEPGGLFGGPADRALRGDGVGRVPNIAPVSALVGSASRTLVLWVQTGLRSRQTLLDVGRSFAGARMLLALTDPSAVPQAPDRRHGVILVLYEADVFIPAIDLSDNRWHQIAVTLQGREALIMIDGELPRGLVWDGARFEPRTQPLALPAPPGTTRTRVSLTGLGAETRTRTWHRGLRGRLDELAIFDRALSPASIRALWRAAGGHTRQ